MSIKDIIELDSEFDKEFFEGSEMGFTEEELKLFLSDSDIE